MKSSVLSLLAATALVAGCNQSVQTASEKFNALPPPVQKTARVQAPDAEIVDVSKTTENGREGYEVTFQGQGSSNPKVFVAPDGTLLSSDFAKTPGLVDKLLTPTGATGTPFSSLPEPVQKTIQAQAPKGQVANISRTTENGRVIYKVEVKDQGNDQTIEVAQDGTLVQNLAK
jgi:uncharacterized membrane protein YkoI